MAFNTIQYCIDRSIPCFTFAMDASKKVSVKWRDINADNFTAHLSQFHNGFAVITGSTHIVIDFDLKHDPPQEIYDILMAGCECVERTPGGYHFWFLIDARTAHFTSCTDAYWDNKMIEGLDIRGKGGICYTAPSHYCVGEIKQEIKQEIKRYVWMKGNLSTCGTMPSAILEHVSYSPAQYDSFSFTIAANGGAVNTVIAANGGASVVGSSSSIESTDDIQSVLDGISQRADSYSDWVKVGMALKNSGYSCELWDDWSKQSLKYTPGECYKKWGTFTGKDRPITVASLYGLLKEDNYELFVSLYSKNDDMQKRLLVATNASIAEAFYEMNPTRYLYSDVEGWYILQPNNVWVATGSKDVLSIPNILNRIREECSEVLFQHIQLLRRGKEKQDTSMQQKLIADAIKRISSASFLKGATAFFTGLYYKRGVERQFNEKRDLFAFTNGVMDMRSFMFRSVEPEDYITVTCGYDWHYNSGYDRVDGVDGVDGAKDMVRAFLAKIFPNSAVLDYVLFALSKTLVGTNTDQVFHVFTGMGANGKSCLMDLCKIVFGDYYQTFSVSYLTKETDGKDKPLPELAAARWARMLVTSEPDERDRFQIGIIKNITGNEEVGFRGMYAKTVTQYVPQYKVWILANDLPRLSKFDQAIERRMRCIPFRVRFVYSPKAENESLRDDTLTAQFSADERWRYGLMGLLLDSARENCGKKLVMPEEVRAFTDGYMMENNPVGAWLRTNYEITGRRDDAIVRHELYEAFLADTGLQKSHKAFAEDIGKCNIQEKKNDTERYYVGLLRK